MEDVGEIVRKGTFGHVIQTHTPSAIIWNETVGLHVDRHSWGKS